MVVDLTRMSDEWHGVLVSVRGRSGDGRVSLFRIVRRSCVLLLCRSALWSDVWERRVGDVDDLNGRRVWNNVVVNGMQVYSDDCI